MKEKRKEEFFEKIKKIHGNKIEILTEFSGSTEPLIYKCNVCKENNEVKRASELVSKKAMERKHSCRNCFWQYKNKKYRQEARDKAVEKVRKHKNVLIKKEFRDEKENRLHFELYCDSCENDWVINATTNLRSNWKGCPECWKKSEERKKATLKGVEISREKRIKEAKEIFFKTIKEENKIEVISEYKTSKTNIKLKCKECKETWETAPGHIVNSGSGCPYCNLGQTKAKLEYIKDVKKKHGDSVKVIEIYGGANKKIVHKCNVCEENWEARPSSVKKGTGCPYCKTSKGEKRISIFLKEKGIPFIPQWKEHTCKSHKKLSFDFYLPTYNLAIEFQGVQHERFSPPLHKTLQDLKDQKKRDKIKREYCKQNNISFLEIWYYEIEKTEEILKVFLEEKKTV